MRSPALPNDIYVIGDSHIGLGEGDESKMLAWLDRFAAKRPQSLYLNGDVFHYFIGDPKFITSSVTGFFRKLRELRERGIAIHYVEGNRDFFLQKSIAEESVSSISKEAVITAGGKRFLVVHGDMVNDRDYPYLFWRIASKNPVMRLGVRMLPKNFARSFVDKAEAKMRMSNFKHKTRIPVELIEAYGRRRSREGIDQVIFGHFHHKLTVPAGDATVTVLPAWFDGGEALVIDAATGATRFEAV